MNQPDRYGVIDIETGEIVEMFRVKGTAINKYYNEIKKCLYRIIEIEHYVAKTGEGMEGKKEE